MEITLGEVSQIVQGEIIGDSSRVVHGVASFKLAQSEHITFADTPKFLKEIYSSKAGVVLVPDNFSVTSGNFIKVQNPRLAFAKLINIFDCEYEIQPGIDEFSKIKDSAYVEASAQIGAFVFIGEDVKIGENTIVYSSVFIDSKVVIGNNTTIYPNVTLMRGCQIGNNVVIHSGTVIGSDGFGFTFDDKRKYHHKVPQIGTVQIDDNVEIGACNTIDRATLGKTWIKSGVKTDNLVHVGHNVIIGKNTLIVANAAIAGSTVVGNNVIIAGKVGIAGHLNIGNNVKIGPKAGVYKDVPDNEIVSGSPSMPHKLWLRVQRIVPMLPDIINSIRQLNKKIKILENKRYKSN